MPTLLSELCKFIDAIDRDECSSASMKVTLPIEWDCGGRRPFDLAPSTTSGHRETMIDRSFVFFVRETVKELKVYKKRFPNGHPLYFAWMVNSKEKVNPRTTWMELLYLLVKLRLQEYRQFDHVYFRRVGEPMPKAWGLQDLVICEYIEPKDCTGGLHSHASIVGFRRVDDVPKNRSSDWYSAVSDQFKKKVHWSFAPDHMTHYYWSLGSWQLLPGFEVFKFLLESVPEEQRQPCLRGKISDEEWRRIYECYGGGIEFTDERPEIEDIPVLRAKVHQHLSETMGPILEQLKSSSAWIDDNKGWYFHCATWTITDYFRFKKLDRDEKSSSLSVSELKRKKIMEGEEWEEDEDVNQESEEDDDLCEKAKNYQKDKWKTAKKGGWTVSPLTPENFPLQIFEDFYQIYAFAPTEDVCEVIVEKPCYPSVSAFEGISRAECQLNDLQPNILNGKKFKLTNACRTLYAMVASFFPKRAGFGIPEPIVPRSPYVIPDDPYWCSYSDEEFQERSKEEKDFCVRMNWELIGVSPEERSNILFVCSCGWLMEREKYRVVYMPNPREVFRDWADDRLLREHFMFAFSGEPITAVIRKTKDIFWGFKLIDQYLESKKLYLLVIVDHLDDSIADGGYSSMCHFVNEDCRRIVLIGNYYRSEEDDDKRSACLLSSPGRLKNFKIHVKTG